jgi:hypothetical protein
VRNIYVEQLRVIREDFETEQVALRYFQQEWGRLQNGTLPPGLRLHQVERSLSQLEATHIIRLFAEFEGILRAYLTIARPGRRLRRTPAEALINSVASRLHIPAPIRDGAHEVRRFRNAIVHSDAAVTPVVGFRQAVSLLNHLLVWLPSPP